MERDSPILFRWVTSYTDSRQGDSRLQCILIGRHVLAKRGKLNGWRGRSMVLKLLLGMFGTTDYYVYHNSNSCFPCYS